MVYGQFNYEQIYNRTRARGKKGTLQASDGDGCLMKTLANITSDGILSAPFFVGNGSGLTNLPSTLQQVVNKGNTVTSNTVQIYTLVTTGSVTGISNLLPVHTLDVGSNLYVSELGSNVLTVLGNVAATYFVGDGSRLSGIQTSSPTLQSVINQGNTFSSNTLIASNILVGNLLTNGLYTGISNVNPVHTLDVGSNLYVSELGSNVLTVLGNVAATYFVGDGSRLSGIQISAPTLQSVINQGNVVTGNTVQLSNLVTTGVFTGISNLLPVHTLDVGSNLYVSETDSNVLFVRGNVAASYFYGNAAYLSGLPTASGSVTVSPVPSNIDRYYPVLSSVTTGTPSLHTSDPNVYYQGSNLYVSGTIKVLNTSKSLIESNIGLAMNQRYGLGVDTNLQKLTLFTPDTEGTISFGQAKSDGTYIELANVNSLSTIVSNLVVSATNGAFTTLIANTINVNQSSTSYKTIKVTSVNGTSLRNLNFTNAIEGAQTIINIYPLRTADLDIFANLSNTVGHVGTRTKVNFLSNIIINSASHAILACYTSDSNTFVSVSEYF